MAASLLFCFHRAPEAPGALALASRSSRAGAIGQAEDHAEPVADPPRDGERLARVLVGLSSVTQLAAQLGGETEHARVPPVEAHCPCGVSTCEDELERLPQVPVVLLQRREGAEHLRLDERNPE